MSPAESDLYRELAQIFQVAFKKASIELRPETTTDDIDGWDSFKYVEILIEIEGKYGFEFEPTEIDDLQNIGDLVGVILAKRV